MIDAAIIRDNYANMNEGQLIRTANEDGHSLTTAAFEILKQEFKKRKLDSAPIELAAQKKTSLQQQKIQQVKDSSDEDFLKAIWKYILEEKETGTADNEILSGLQERGLDEETAISTLLDVPHQLKEIINGLDTKILINAAAFIIGIFITILTYSNAFANGGYYYITWGAVVFGATGFFKGLAKKRKYKHILTGIENSI